MQGMKSKNPGGRIDSEFLDFQPLVACDRTGIGPELTSNNSESSVVSKFSDFQPGVAYERKYWRQDVKPKNSKTDVVSEFLDFRPLPHHCLIIVWAAFLPNKPFQLSRPRVEVRVAGATRFSWNVER